MSNFKCHCNRSFFLDPLSLKAQTWWKRQLMFSSSGCWNWLQRRNKLRSQNGLQGLCFHDSVQTVGVLVILLLPYRPVRVCVRVFGSVSSRSSSLTRQYTSICRLKQWQTCVSAYFRLEMFILKDKTRCKNHSAETLCDWEYFTFFHSTELNECHQKNICKIRYSEEYIHVCANNTFLWKYVQK